MITSAESTICLRRSIRQRRLETDDSNNVGQAPQTVQVSGPVIVDNSQPGYSETGSDWLNWASGYGGTLRYHAAGSGTNTAVWQATGLTPGYYQVQATWNSDNNHANNAPFSIYDGSTLLQTVLVNQRPAPSGTIVSGKAFQKLITVQVTSGSLTVVLSDAGNGYVVADAVRLEPSVSSSEFGMPAAGSPTPSGAAITPPDGPFQFESKAKTRRAGHELTGPILINNSLLQMLSAFAPAELDTHSDSQPWWVELRGERPSAATRSSDHLSFIDSNSR